MNKTDTTIHKAILTFISTSRLKFSNTLRERYLIDKGIQSQAMRRYDDLTQIGLLLNESESQTSRGTGDYFLGLGIMHGGRENVEIGKDLLENAAELARPAIRARSMLALGGLAARRGDQDEPYYYLESMRLAREASDGYSLVLAPKQIAHCKEKNGDTKFALEDLENLLPLVRKIAGHCPIAYADFLNSYAILLNDTGHFEMARNVQAQVLTSPYITAYPEWIETMMEIKEQLPSKGHIYINDLSFYLGPNVHCLQERREERTTSADLEPAPPLPPIETEDEAMLRLFAEMLELIRQMGIRERTLALSAMREIMETQAQSKS